MSNIDDIVDNFNSFRIIGDARHICLNRNPNEYTRIQIVFTPNDNNEFRYTSTTTNKNYLISSSVIAGTSCFLIRDYYIDNHLDDIVDNLNSFTKMNGVDNGRYVCKDRNKIEYTKIQRMFTPGNNGFRYTSLITNKNYLISHDPNVGNYCFLIREEDEEMRRIVAENRMREIREANLRMFEESSGSDESDEDNNEKPDEKENESDFSIGKKCNNKTNLSLITRFDSLENKNIIIILKKKSEGEYIHECYTVDEITSLTDPENQVYIWYKGAVKYAPVYKLPFSGIWIDSLSMKMLKMFNTFVVESLGKFKIGSTLGVSQLHGAIEEIFFLRPIHQETLNPEEEGVFVATDKDVIRDKYHKWEYDQRKKTDKSFLRTLVKPQNNNENQMVLCRAGIGLNLVCELKNNNIVFLSCKRYLGEISEDNDFTGVGYINDIQPEPYKETIQFAINNNEVPQGIKFYNLRIYPLNNQIVYDKLEKEFSNNYSFNKTKIEGVDMFEIKDKNNPTFYMFLVLEVIQNILHYDITFKNNNCISNIRYSDNTLPEFDIDFGG